MKNLMKICTLLFFSLVIMLTGCATSSKQSGQKSMSHKAKTNMNKVNYHGRTPINRVNYPQKTTHQTTPINQHPKSGVNFRLADHVAKRVSHLKGVHSASAVIHGNKAYIAVSLRDHAKLTKKMERRISKQAKRYDHRLKHVYVSTDSRFAKHLKHYSHQVRSGHPVQGMTKNLHEMVRRTYPTAR